MTSIDNDAHIISNLCGNQSIYNDILFWLKSFNYDEKISENSCVFIVGNACIGKSYSVKSICNYLNLFIINIDTNNCWNTAQFKDLIFKGVTASLIQSIEKTSMKKVIILDNFDSLFNTDKTINQALLQILRDKKLKNIPIICITNPETLKKMGDIKKICCIYDLQPPTNKEIHNTLKAQNIKIKKCQEFIKKYDCNLTKIFENIYNDDEYVYDNKDENYDMLYLYKCNNFDRNIIRNILISDAWLIPLRFHENLIVELNNRAGTNKIKNQFYVKFINLFCYFDVLMNTNNIECALEVFVSIIYYLTLLKIKKDSLCNMNKFTKILSYLSLQKKYIKHYFNSSFPLYQIGNYHTCLLNRKFIYFN